MPMGSTDWTQWLIKNNRMADTKLGGRLAREETDGRKVVVCGFGQNTLLKCVKISKNKNTFKKLSIYCIHISL